jgi:hypothetical protein
MYLQPALAGAASTLGPCPLSDWTLSDHEHMHTYDTEAYDENRSETSIALA